QSLSIKTFFCDPHAPWQKGGIENAIGRMRRFIPRNTDLDKLPTRRLRQSIAAYNNTPRKCLDFRTPAEVFAAQVLHFECESTSWLSPGRRCGESRGPDATSSNSHAAGRSRGRPNPGRSRRCRDGWRGCG